MLHDIDLEVPGAGRLVLVGPSGAGKTTLLRVVAGLEPSATGSVECGGARIDGLAPHRRPIAMVFQEPRLFPGLDVGENVGFALRARGVRRAERRARARSLLAEVGLDGFGARSVEGLSGGEQQRVALARALCAEPALLLLDEPTASVDPARREDLRRLILRLPGERGVTMLLVTHDRDEAAAAGERVALLIGGRLVQAGPPEELFLRPASPVVAHFLGLRNVLEGTVRGGILHTGAGPVPVPGPDGPARVVVRAEGVVIDPEGVTMTVAEASFTGTAVRLVLRSRATAIEAVVPPDRAPPAGSVVGVRIPSAAVWRFPGHDAD